MVRQHRLVYAALILALIANMALWASVRDVKGRWQNVPPVPSENGILVFSLGDPQFAYRFVGLMLQNLGDIGGRSTMLRDYDYNTLTKWFYLSDKLDPRSEFVPYLASYYYGAVTPPEVMRPMLAYLRDAGSREGGERWRWLAQAVYLARFGLHDMDYATTLAYELADHPSTDMPGWARQMPAYVLNAKGDKEAAYNIMTQTLKSSADKLAPQEVNSMRLYICTRILNKQQAQEDPLCENLPL